jgi:hypothetical protein
MEMSRSHRVAGALIGSAVGDALGAPFEFGPSGQFTARFPTDARGLATEMCGDGPTGRAPGTARPSSPSSRCAAPARGSRTRCSASPT